MRRLDDLLLDRPWLYAALAGGLMFVAFLQEWPLPAAAVVALAVVLLVGWSWTNGPSRKAYEERQAYQTAGAPAAGHPAVLVWYGVVAIPFGIGMAIWGVADGIDAVVLVGALLLVAGVASIAYWRRKVTHGPAQAD